MIEKLSVGVGIVLSDANDRILVTLRRAGTYFGGWWEFPGGKCEPGEPPDACVVRELCEEVGITVRPFHALPPVDYHYADRNREVRLFPWVCRLVEGDPAAIEVDEFRWVAPSDVQNLRILPASIPIIQQFCRELCEILAQERSGKSRSD